MLGRRKIMRRIFGFMVRFLVADYSMQGGIADSWLDV